MFSVNFMIFNKFPKEKEPNLIKMEDPVCIFGDLHGHFYDLLNIYGIIQGI